MYLIKKDIAEKVLMVGPDYIDHKGGIGAVIALQKPSYEVFNFIPTYRPFENNLSKSLFFIKQLFKVSVFLIKNPSIKIVHMHTSQDGSFFRKLVILYVSKKVFRKKVINHTNASHFHTFYENSPAIIKTIIRYYLNNCDVTIAVSESWKNYYKDTFSLVNVYKVFNLSEKKQLDQQSLDEKKKGDRKIQFLFLGRVGDRKGTFDLVQAIVKNKECLTGKIFLTIGGDGEVEKLKRTIEQEGISHIVRYLGWISGDKKDELLRTADVFVLPSYHEGMPLSILEAMGYGKPIISTPVSGILELVFREKNGLIVTPGNHDEIFQAIAHYVKNPADIFRHGQQSLQIIKDFYPDAVIPRLEKIYASLLN